MMHPCIGITVIKNNKQFLNVSLPHKLKNYETNVHNLHLKYQIKQKR